MNQEGPIAANAFQGQLWSAFSRCQNVDVPNHGRARGHHTTSVQCS